MPNIICWLSLKIMFLWGEFFGTLKLYIKARILGIKIGKGVTAHGSVALMRWPGSRIIIEDNVSFISSWRRATACALAHPVRLRVFNSDAFIHIKSGAQLSGTSITCRSKSIIIGKNVLLAPNCVIVDSDFHSPWPYDTRSENPGYENDSPVYIDDYAWIGMNCIILKGVNIGKGAIIGAGSVVTRDIPAYSVAAGVPARVISTHVIKDNEQ